jgi:integrase
MDVYAAGWADLPLLIQMLVEQRRLLAKERLKAGSEWVDHDLVFPSPVGTPSTLRTPTGSFIAVRAAAGVRPRRLHDWRVTAGSWLGDLNVRPDTAKQMLRHSQHSTTMKHYTRTSSAVRREPVEALDELFKVVSVNLAVKPPTSTPEVAALNAVDLR